MKRQLEWTPKGLASTYLMDETSRTEYLSPIATLIWVYSNTICLSDTTTDPTWILSDWFNSEISSINDAMKDVLSQAITLPMTCLHSRLLELITTQAIPTVRLSDHNWSTKTLRDTIRTSTTADRSILVMES